MVFQVEAGVCTVTLRGELDAGIAAECEARLFDAADSLMQPRMVVDLRELRFIDSIGVRVLMRLHRLTHALGGGLKLIPGPEAMRMIALAGLEGAFRIVPAD